MKSSPASTSEPASALDLSQVQDRMDRQLKELKTTINSMEALGKVADGRIQELKAAAEEIQSALMAARQSKPQRSAPPAARLAFTLKETAMMLGVSPISLYRLVERGLIRPSVALRRKIFSKAEIERFLRETTVDF